MSQRIHRLDSKEYGGSKANHSCIHTIVRIERTSVAVIAYNMGGFMGEGSNLKRP